MDYGSIMIHDSSSFMDWTFTYLSLEDFYKSTDMTTAPKIAEKSPIN